MLPLEREFGGSINLGTLTSDYTLSKRGHRLVYAVPNAGRTVSLYPTTGLLAGGPYHFIVNASDTNTLDVDADGGAPVVTLATEEVGILCLLADGTWLGLTQPLRGLSGPGTTLDLDYGSAAAPTGQSLDFGTAAAPSGPALDLNLLI